MKPGLLRNLSQRWSNSLVKGYLLMFCEKSGIHGFFYFAQSNLLAIEKYTYSNDLFHQTFCKLSTYLNIFSAADYSGCCLSFPLSTCVLWLACSHGIAIRPKVQSSPSKRTITTGTQHYLRSLFAHRMNASTNPCSFGIATHFIKV